jgi:SSS family solute:Na+ symporter
VSVLLGFSNVDWWIVGIYVFLAALPGFLCRKYIIGQSDFLIAGRTLSVFIATATLTATEMGLVTVMYWSEFGYTMGFSSMSMGLIALLATLFVGMTGFMVAGLRQSNATTIAEYYQIRFSKGVRTVGGLIIAAAGILNYGLFLQVEAKFIQIVTGIPDLTIAWQGGTPITISAVALIMIVTVIIVVAYTLMGGMVSVAVTDYIQFIVLTVGLGATTYWVMTHEAVGGFSGMLDAVQEHRPEYGLNPFKRVEGPSGALVGLGVVWIIWQSLHWLGTNTWQTGAFRTAATDSPRTARLMWSLTAFNYFGRGVIPMIWGIGALAFLSHTMSASELADVPSREAMPMLVANLPTGLVGLLMAGMMAALMSTHSSYLLTWSGVVTEDLIAPFCEKAGMKLSEKRRVQITRIFIVLLGIFLLYWGFFYEVKKTIWGYLAVTGTMYVAGSLTLVAFGLYWKRATKFGAYAGLLGGALPGVTYIVLDVLVNVGAVTQDGSRGFLATLSQNMTDDRTGLSSFILAFLGMVIGSLVTKPDLPDETAVQDAVMPWIGQGSESGQSNTDNDTNAAEGKGGDHA